METLLLCLLAAQGAMAGVDTVLNHEILARLPQRPQARTEIGLHVLRESIWTVLLGGLAWFAWHGAAAWIINLGAVIMLLVPVLAGWSQRPSGLAASGHGALSWLLTLLALAAATWAVRDLFAWRRLGLRQGG